MNSRSAVFALAVATVVPAVIILSSVAIFFFLPSDQAVSYARSQTESPVMSGASVLGSIGVLACICHAYFVRESGSKRRWAWIVALVFLNIGIAPFYWFNHVLQPWREAI